jgi:putative heme-binding domain-containing protein
MIDITRSVDDRARSYLHANCGHCHRTHAGSAVLSKMTFDLPLDKTDMLGVRPTQGTFGLHDARVIAPADPYRSVLLYRMAKLGSGRMPHIGSTEVDREGLNLLFDWIAGSPPEREAEKPARPRGEDDRADLARLQSDTTRSNDQEVVDRLLSTTRGAFLALRALDEGTLPAVVRPLIVKRGATHAESSVRDLFERYLPSDQRVQRLGSLIQPGQILAIPGDAARGKEIFLRTAGVSCGNCHRVGNEGTELGPELTLIGKKYDRPALLESILEPSKVIDPKYITYLIETRDGRVLSGLLVERNDEAVVLRDARNNLHRIQRLEVEQLVAQQQSLMPELQLRDLTAQQAADLIEYLSSLK